jgi:hypothetical protein
MVSTLTKTNFDKAIEQQTISRGFATDANHTYTPAEAQAMIANLVANPIPAVNGTKSFETDLGIFGGLKAHYTQGRSGYHVEDTRIEDQSGKPTKPATRYFSGSTVGQVIPISMGKRRLVGNVISASAIVPNMLGTKTYTVEYEIPIYEDPPINPTYGIHLDSSGGNNDPSTGSNSVTCNQDETCDTKTIPDLPPTDTIPDDGGGGGGGGGGAEYYYIIVTNPLGQCYASASLGDMSAGPFASPDEACTSRGHGQLCMYKRIGTSSSLQRVAPLTGEVIGAGDAGSCS